jgi:hypothetical protein
MRSSAKLKWKTRSLVGIRSGLALRKTLIISHESLLLSEHKKKIFFDSIQSQLLYTFWWCWRSDYLNDLNNLFFFLLHFFFFYVILFYLLTHSLLILWSKRDRYIIVNSKRSWKSIVFDFKQKIFYFISILR